MGDLRNTICPECGRHHPVLEDCRDYVLMPVDPDWRPRPYWLNQRETIMSIMPINATCNTELMVAGQAYPKTCAGCGLTGLCKFHAAPGDAFGEQWAASFATATPHVIPFPDGIKLAPGWWKSRNGMIFNIDRTSDGKFINVNSDGKVEPSGAIFGWNADGTNRFTPIRDGEADQDFALVERIGSIASAALPIHGKFVVAVVRDPTHPMGWHAQTFKDGVPSEIREHHPGVLAVKVVEFVEGEWE